MMNRTNKEYLWTSDEISKVLDVPRNREWKASGVSIDSRSIETGDLFVAIEGPNYDGHDFVRQAFEAGAAAAEAVALSRRRTPRDRARSAAVGARRARAGSPAARLASSLAGADARPRSRGRAVRARSRCRPGPSPAWTA